MERRLVTIMGVDAVDYSRLVRENEEATVDALEACLAIIRDSVREHRGRVFGGAGDSIIAEFASPSEAVRSAVEVQQRLEARNAAAHAQRITFRIGLNLGDVIDQDGNLLGDGVNVAARLESLAPPGGIYVSQSVYEQVKHLPDILFDDVGQRRLKNIPTPVHIYLVHVADLRRSPGLGRLAIAVAVLVMLALIAVWQFWPAASTKVLAWIDPPHELPAQPSIAVLPLANLSGDENMEYFSDGITNDITTDLSKFANLLVIASNSAFAYKGRSVRAQDIGRDLKVRYLLEGTVFRGDGRLRVNAQLIDATTGHHIWAERYDRAIDDWFAVQDDIVAKIVTNLALKVDAAERRRIASRETESMDAYDYWLQGREVWRNPANQNEEGNNKARELFQKSAEADPNFARAYGYLSYAYLQDWQNDWGDDPEAALQTALELAQKAVALDPDDYDNHWALAIVYGNMGDFDRSFAEYDRARTLNANDADLLAEMGEVLIDAGRSDEAVKQVQEALTRNPNGPPYWYYWTLGRALYFQRRYREAIEAIESISDPPSDARLVTAASYAQLGEMKQAAAEMAIFRAGEPEWTLEKSRRYHYADPKDREHWLDGLRKAGLPEN